MDSLLSGRRFGCSIAVLVTASALFPFAVEAQSAQPGNKPTPQSAQAELPPAPPAEAAQDAELTEITVTGTSIRGVAPVGSSVINVGPADIASSGAMNLQQALVNVPALTGAGNVGQGQTNNSYYQPTIHSLGASASNSTLILIDGHRPPTGGTNHSTADPNIIPLNMIDHVDVLADGASSVYGSDAVAGVVNFITRSSFDGIEASGSGGFIDGAQQYNAGLLAGKSWDAGSTIFAYTYTREGALNDVDRPYTNPDHIGQGGTNFGNFNCGTATLQPGGAGPIYVAGSPTPIANTAANSPCSQWADAALVLQEIRNNAMVKTELHLSDDLTVAGEVLYAQRRDQGLISAGTVTATAYAAGPQANPFYQSPAGYTGSATSETVRFDANSLLGPAITYNGSDDAYGDFKVNYKIGNNFQVDALALIGRDDSFSVNTGGSLNASSATLALNGSTNSAGNITIPSIAGTNTIVTNLPLTTANALNAWSPNGAGTSAATIAALLDNGNLLRLVSQVQQFRLSTNGTLFEIPAGAVRIAVGVEDLRTQLDEFVDRSNNSGPASNGSQYLTYDFSRTVNSAYGELDLPVVGPTMNVPFVHRLDLDVSGRFDHYSDFGSTTNPKFGIDWVVIQGVKLRGSVSRSFVAPPLDVLANQYNAYATAGWNSTTNSIAVPVARFPTLPSLGIPGCTATSVTCNISSLQGIQVTSGNHEMTAQRGRGWTVGTDFNPPFLPNLSANITLWDTQFIGAVTAPTIANAVNVGSLNPLLTFYPGGATPAQLTAATVGIPQRTTVPTEINYIFQSRAGNYLNLYVRGIDAAINYTFPTAYAGTFKTGVSATEFLKFDQSYGDGPIFNVINTSGSNTSFPSVATQGRANFDWLRGPISADLFFNYTGSYRNYSGTSVQPVIRDSSGNPIGGGDGVKANYTFDAHVGFDFSAVHLGNETLSLTVRNLFNRQPPFYNSIAGYDTYVASPLGRQVTLGFTAKFL
jgi:iron complex outermembrane recepter protein